MLFVKSSYNIGAEAMVHQTVPLTMFERTLVYKLMPFGPPCTLEDVVREIKLPDASQRFEVWLPSVVANVCQRFWHRQ